MRRINIFIVVVLITAATFAQNEFNDVAYLRDSNMIRKIIAKQLYSNLLKPDISNKKLLEFNFIEKVAKKVIGINIETKSDSIEFKPSFKSTVELGYDIGSGDYGMDRINLNFIEHYQLKQYLSIGMGIGLRYYLDDEAVLVPLFVDVRTSIEREKISPYAAIGFGYSFDASNGFEGVGILIKPSIGVIAKISQESSINFGLGYEIQQMKFHYTNEFSANSNAISIIIGLSF